MSEKRFKMGESDIQGEMMFIDTQTNKIYWQEYFDEIVDLVNEQQDIIKKQCNHKKAILDFLKFMRMDNPLMEIMIDEFLEEVYDFDKVIDDE